MGTSSQAEFAGIRQVSVVTSSTGVSAGSSSSGLRAGFECVEYGALRAGDREARDLVDLVAARRVLARMEPDSGSRPDVPLRARHRQVDRLGNHVGKVL